MRYSPEHKKQAREKLLANGAGYAKQHGFSASGVDALAAAAGVTSGSLYKNFSNKTELFAALIDAELRKSVNVIAEVPAGDMVAFRTLLLQYLSLDHVEHPQAGCPIPALTAEVARVEEPVRRIFESGISDLVSLLEKWTGSRESAWALLCQSVGAVMVARAFVDNDMRHELLSAVREQSERALFDLGPNGSTCA